jgi:hypothetical protein
MSFVLILPKIKNFGVYVQGRVCLQSIVINTSLPLPRSHQVNAMHMPRSKNNRKYAEEFEERRIASSTGGLGVGTPRSPILHTSNLHSKDTLLLLNSR